MLILAIFLAAFLLSVALQAQINGNEDLAALYRGQVFQQQIVRMAEAMEGYQRDKNALPADVDTLVATPGYEHAKSFRNSWQGYMKSGSLDDGVWSFERAVVFQNNPSGGVTGATYLAENTCGTGSASTAQSWCGLKSSNWYRVETREKINEQLTTQRVRMGRMLQKLATYYSKENFFPKKDAGGTDLVANSITRLKTLAGYAGSSTSCFGTYTWQGVPIDCSDMFDIWGGEIGYQFITEDHVVLVSESPFTNSATPPSPGTRVIVAANLEILPP